MGKLSEEVKSLRKLERARVKARKVKRVRETASAIHAQKIRKRQRCK